MWRPCFGHLERRDAVLEGYARRFSIWTSLARGTPERPGLAMGLEAAAGRCPGIAFRLDPAQLDEAMEALWEREMVTGIYEPRWLLVETERGPLTALAFVVDQSHRQYAGKLPQDTAAAIIAGANGKFGSCRDYLANTVAALRAAGYPDAELEALLDAVQNLP
jgi:cation transport protein ChaC